MMPLQTHIISLREQVRILPVDWQRVGQDFRAGRVDVMTAQTYCEAAQTALDAGDEAKAALHLVEALAAWSRALTMQMPTKHIAKLSERPDLGGRPKRETLGQRLREKADAQPTGTIIAKCRAAIAADEKLEAAYGKLSDGQVRRAYSNK